MTFWSVTLELLGGFGNTALIFLLTLVFAIPLGLIIAFGAMVKFKPLKYLVKTVIWIVRGTPLMLQIMVFFYVPGLMFGMRSMDRFPTVIVAFSINYACYFAEIFRGGIESIPKGQYEAGKVLGMNRAQVFFHVVLMQVVKQIMAPMSNEFMTLVKDTSLARVIMVVEIIDVAKDFSARGIIWPLFYTGAFYLAFVGLLTLLFGWAEKKLSYYKV